MQSLRPTFKLFATLAAVMLALLLARDAPVDADYTPPASPPPEYQALYDELSQNLTTFEAQLDTQWDGSVGSGRFAGALVAANGNKTVALLGPSAWTRIIEMLDAFESMGVTLIKIDVQYPALTPAFHTYLTANPPPYLPGYQFTAGDMIGAPASFYNRLEAEIRGRGMDLWVEYATLFAGYTITPPTGYFADMRTAGLAATQARYRAERAAEAALIAANIHPDYFTVMEEPTTQEANFGYFPGSVPLHTPAEWAALTQYLATQAEAAGPGAAMLVGAGSGTWETRDYTERFAAIPELDYVDFHMYPLGTPSASFLQNALDWADYVRAVAPAKKLTLGEAWLYKASEAEVAGGLDYNVILGRDTYSFWEPLDRQMLDVVFKVVHYKDFDGAMPFWSQYYFAYLTYGDPDLAGLTDIELIALAGQRAIPNIASVTLTGTGQKFAELIAASQAADSDNDGYTDIAEAGTPLCGDGRNEDNADDAVIDDGCPGGPAQAGAFSEAQFNIGTSKIGGCGAGPVPAVSESWPSDLSSGGVPDSTDRVNVLDLTSLLAPVRRLNSDPEDAEFSPRMDLAPGRGLFVNWINVTDLTALLAGSTGYPPMFVGAKAFNGPACTGP